MAESTDRFKTADKILEVVWNMKTNDLPRSSNRARIDALFNGRPPYTDVEAAENRISVNFNDLSATNLAHNARGQFNNAFLSTENFFTVKIDYGPRHKRAEWSEIVTQEINRRMKRNRYYSDCLRDVFRQVVLHGIGPVVWRDKQKWVPQMQMVPDVLLPSRTLLSMENVEYFGVFRRYNAAQLWRQTHGPKVDKGWNIPLADKCIEWAYHQWGATNSGTETVYAPEKWQEDIKSDSGLAASDVMPTVDCWEFYSLNDDKKNWGWNRKIVLDTPSGSEANTSGKDQSRIQGSKKEFLYDSGKRRAAQQMDQIIHFQFADGAVVAPARYHSVRSLGFLLYAVCHVQNRLRCRFTEHAFENLLQYFRISNPDDAERLTKLDLVNRGIIPDGMTFVTQQERWQVNEGMIGAVMAMNRQSMDDHSTSFTQQFDYARDKREKTATQVMAEVNAASALTTAMLADAYGYQEWQYREIGRRFCVADSSDLDVRAFRTACLKQGVPKEALNVDCWDVKSEKIMGGGNRQLAIAQSELIMQSYQLLDPDAQRVALRNRMFAVTGDAALTNQLVPAERSQVTNSIHDAQVSSSALLSGLPMGLKQGVNHAEYAEALLQSMSARVDTIEARGGMATAEEIMGLHNIAGVDIEGQPIEGNGISMHIMILEQDDTNKAQAKELNDALGQLMNLVKAYEQRLAEQEQAAVEQNGESQNGESQAKVQAMMMQAQAKVQAKQMADEQKLQQKDQQFQQRMEQDRVKNDIQLANELRRTELEETALDIRTAGAIKREPANSQE